MALKPSQFEAGGKIWDCAINLGKAYEVDDCDFSALTSIKFSILEPTKEFFQLLMQKQRVTFAIIWVLIRDQVKANLGVDPTESAQTDAEAQKLWLSLLDGESIDAGRRALFNALGDFFPERRIALSTLLSQYEKGRAAVNQEIQTLAPDMEAFLTDDLRKRVTALRTALVNRDIKSLKELEKTLDEDAGEILSTSQA